ncbi:MAG: LysR family transcriptional regulator [Aestuariivirga sp.]
MDIELARTFIEIVSTGSFIRASEQLNVAQTTVSARIRSLEQQLGRALFVRNKGGASLTPAGEQFLRYAPMFVQLWQRTLHQIAVPPGHRAVLTIGSEVSLWQSYLIDWIRWMRRSLPDIALRVHVDVPQDLINQVASGMVDMAIMHAPQQRSGIKIDLLMEDKLVFVTTDRDVYLLGGINYVYMDWGPDFTLHHRMNFPDSAPDLVMDLGPLGLSYILSAGGSGYFRMSAVGPHITAGRLHLVHEMAQFSYPVYAVRSANTDEAVVGSALAALHAISNAEIE